MSKIKIWNMALGFIGTRTIASDKENNLEAVQCALFWDNARQQALRDFPYNFAQRRMSLAQTIIPKGYEYEYAYAYDLPNDCLKALYVLPYASASIHDNKRFILAYDEQNGRSVLLTNVDKALLCYTADVEDTTRFDALFTIMLARKLACLIAVPLLKNNTNKLSELEQLYRASIPEAMEADASEGRERAKPDSWLKARGLY